MESFLNWNVHEPGNIASGHCNLTSNSHLCKRANPHKNFLIVALQTAAYHWGLATTIALLTGGKIIAMMRPKA